MSVMTRPCSTTKYPSKINFEKVEYSDKSFLESALQVQYVVIILLGFVGLPYQEAIIKAAASAEVQYILLAAYSLDSGNDKIFNAVEVIQDERDVQKKIEPLCSN